MSAFTMELEDFEIGAFTASTVEASFDIDAEEVQAEPYSWGGSRGMELCGTARLKFLPLGLKVLRRPDLVELIGEAEVSGLEKEAFEKWGETQ